MLVFKPWYEMQIASLNCDFQVMLKLASNPFIYTLRIKAIRASVNTLLGHCWPQRRYPPTKSCKSAVTLISNNSTAPCNVWWANSGPYRDGSSHFMGILYRTNRVNKFNLKHSKDQIYTKKVQICRASRLKELAILYCEYSLFNARPIINRRTYIISFF